MPNKILVCETCGHVPPSEREDDPADLRVIEAHNIADFKVAEERARCLAIATDLLARGPGFPCSSEFADGYLLAAQELVAGITGEGQ